MKTRALILGLALAGAAAWVAACASQPPLPCIVARASSGSSWAAVYTPTNPAQVDAGSLCYWTGDNLGTEKYNPSTNPDPSKGIQDYHTAQLVLETGNMAGLVQAFKKHPDPAFPDGGHLPYSSGSYPVNPDSQGLCSVPTMTPAELHFPASTLGPEADWTYTWKNVSVASAATAPGTQMKAQLTIAEPVSGCSIDYNVWGVWPAATCQALDSTGNPLTDDAGNPALDQAQCDPAITGISNNFPVACTNIGQPGTFTPTCVLTKEPPAIYAYTPVDGGSQASTTCPYLQSDLANGTVPPGTNCPIWGAKIQ